MNNVMLQYVHKSAFSENICDFSENICDFSENILLCTTKYGHVQ